MKTIRFVFLLSFTIALIAIFLAQIWDQLIDHFIEYNKDIDKNTRQLIESVGFRAEDHYVVTEDGYILLLTRIVNPFAKRGQKLAPVLLHHGWETNANCWIINSGARLDQFGHYVEDTDSGPIGNNLGFVLAINGFDVWLANMRGSLYSTNHTKMSVQDAEFWRFSVDELIQYDLPSMISHIQRVTGKRQVSYVGHSQGNFLMFSFLSSQPRYSEIVKPFIALSPVFYFDHSKTVSPLLTIHNYLYSWMRYREAKHPFHGTDRLMARLSKVCDFSHQSRKMCHKVIYFLLGFIEKQCNLTRLPVYISNLLTGASSWNTAHLIQSIRLGSVKKFDYGDPEKNKLKYGSSVPPDYDLGSINSTNIALIYTANDYLNHLQDVQRLKDGLQVPLLDDYLVPEPDWNHLELLWAIDSGKLINTRVLQILLKTIN